MESEEEYLNNKKKRYLLETGKYATSKRSNEYPYIKGAGEYSDDYVRWLEEKLDEAKQGEVKSEREKMMERMIEEVLFYSMTTGGGGFVSEFGPILFGKMVGVIDYDINKRDVCRERKVK